MNQDYSFDVFDFLTLASFSFPAKKLKHSIRTFNSFQHSVSYKNQYIANQMTSSYMKCNT